MADALFPETRQRVLMLFFGQPERAFTTKEVIELVGSGTGAVQRELERLVASGLVSCIANGRTKLYQAERASPIFEELTSIVEKTVGIPELIASALTKLRGKIQFAVLFGSVAKATDTARSDVDVLIVADDLALEDAFEALQPAEARLGRRVSPTMYTSEEFLHRRRTNNPFLTKVLAGQHVVLIGSEDAVIAAR